MIAQQHAHPRRQVEIADAASASSCRDTNVLGGSATSRSSTNTNSATGTARDGRGRPRACGRALSITYDGALHRAGDARRFRAGHTHMFAAPIAAPALLSA